MPDPKDPARYRPISPFMQALRDGLVPSSDRFRKLTTFEDSLLNIAGKPKRWGYASERDERGEYDPRRDSLSLMPGELPGEVLARRGKLAAESMPSRTDSVESAASQRLMSMLRQSPQDVFARRKQNERRSLEQRDGVLAHELGHRISMGGSRQDIAGPYNKYIMADPNNPKFGRPDTYAATNGNEHFAEAFRVATQLLQKTAAVQDPATYARLRDSAEADVPGAGFLADRLLETEPIYQRHPQKTARDREREQSQLRAASDVTAVAGRPRLGVLRRVQAPDGQIEPGNIDLSRRPRVKNADGSVSTVRSMSFEEDGREVLVPTVSDDGRILSDDEAMALYDKTGRHLGKFATPAAATAYAQKLHKDQEQQYVTGLPRLRLGLFGRKP